MAVPAPAPAAADQSAQILDAISQLMQQYLQLGPDTPLAQTFSQVLPEIEQGMQGMGGQPAPPGMDPSMGAPPGGPPGSPPASPDQGQLPPEMMQELLAQSGGQPPLTGNEKTDFGNASAAASKNMEQTGSYKKKKSKGK
jgi:hypothetical protein